MQAAFFLWIGGIMDGFNLGTAHAAIVIDVSSLATSLQTAQQTISAGLLTLDSGLATFQHTLDLTLLAAESRFITLTGSLTPLGAAVDGKVIPALRQLTTTLLQIWLRSQPGLNALRRWML